MRGFSEPDLASPNTVGQWHAVSAGFLGWTLDAFDFFVLIFLIDTLALQFHVAKSAIIWTITATLAMRPIGALVFGLLADRYGRRRPLIANIVFFSAIEVLCGFAPNYKVFLILRALYGIGMGGEWGVGASLAMESAPRKLRGFLSGVLQAGYPIGYLLAAIAARFVQPFWGWRAMFWIGGAPAILAFYIRYRVPESASWKKHHIASFRGILTSARSHWKLVTYLIAMMTFMMFLSHGTQDLYPDFLKSVHRISSAVVSYIAIVYNVGAIVGSIIFGYFSERWGRRYSMIGALMLSLFVIPGWAFGNSVALLAIAAFAMQAGVQGAWGIIPAHLNEVSPDALRGLIPGFAYQMGIVLAAGTGTFEYALKNRFGYSWALAGFEIANILILTTVIAMGSEKKGRDFVRETS